MKEKAISLISAADIKTVSQLKIRHVPGGQSDQRIIAGSKNNSNSRTLGLITDWLLISRLDNACEKPCCIDRKGHSLIASEVKEVDELQRHSALSIFSTQDTAATKQQFKR